jgi:hypothetical protein
VSSEIKQEIIIQSTEKMENKMLKKVVLGTVFVVFIGALITGAVIRTMDKSEQTAEQVGSGEGRGRNASDENNVVVDNQGNGQGNGQGKGRSEEAESESITQGRGRGGKGGVGSELLPEGESDHQWDAYSGVVTEVTEEMITIETDDAEVVVVEGRAWSFAQEQGYVLQQGDKVELEGFYEGGEYKASRIENLSTGESIVLRDQTGRPSWAGGGRGNL